MSDIILQDKILIAKDTDLIDPELVKSRYVVTLFDERKCSPCSNRPFRLNDICKSCPAFQGTYNFAASRTVKDREYHAVPLADIQFIKNAVKGKSFLAVNETRRPPMRHPLTFTGKLFGPNAVDADGNPRADQEVLVAQWMKEKNGIIQAAARSGKTVLAVNIACTLGLRTVVIAHQIELLQQFYATFVGGESRKAMTDAAAIAKRTGTPTVKIADSIDDLTDRSIDVLLINPQKMQRHLDRLTELVKGQWGLLIADEIHQTFAAVYSQVINAFDAPYRLGLSATPERKDGRDRLAEFLVGPVTAKSQIMTLKPLICARMVDATPSTQYKTWNGAQQWAADNPERNKQIIAAVFDDLAEGHTSIIVPVAYVRHVELLTRVINATAARRNETRGEKWPADLAVPFTAKSNRKYALDRVDDGNPCVLIAIASIVKQGIDMRTPTSLHIVNPMSASAAVGAPMFQQMSYRVATPMPGKRQPKVTLWIDNIGLFQSCLKGLFWNEISPGVKDNRYVLHPETRALITSLNAKGAKRRPAFNGSWT